MDSANPVNPKEKRKHMRFALLSEAIEFYTVDGWKTFKMDNISEAGAFLESDTYLTKHDEPRDVYLQLPGDLGKLMIQGKVNRVNWVANKKKELKKGFAIEFIVDNVGHQKIIDAYVTYLRNKQIITVSKRIIEEFFGSQHK